MTDADAAQLSHLLRTAGIAHGTLRRTGTWGNYAYTDFDAVFVKANRPSEPSAATALAREPSAAAWAAARGVRTSRPLLADALRWTDEGGSPRAATVWRYAHPGPALPAAAGLAGLLDTASQLSLLEPPAHLSPAQWDDAQARGLVRLAQLDAGAVDPTTRRLLEAALEDTGPVLARGFATAAPYATHGDLHQGNLYVTRQGPLVVDWELFGAAPAEWEYGTIAALACTWPGAGAPDPTRLVAGHSGAPALDSDLLRAVTRLRAANCVTRLLADGETGAWLANLRTLLHQLS